MTIKIAVYTICHNEADNVPAWLANIREAEFVAVGDTASTDGTKEMLQQNGAVVHDVIVTPWRFDAARNQLLDMLPLEIDLCISLDLDERLNSGWYDRIQAVYAGEATRLHYRYRERGAVITASRIHSRHGYKWLYPVHETLSYCGIGHEVSREVDGLIVDHFPNEAKNRSQYLNLMELAVKEHPGDARMLYQLARDYLQYGQFQRCIANMQDVLKLDNIPADQRRASRRLMARAYGEMNQYDVAIRELNVLIREAPYCISAYVEYAIMCYKYERWDDLVKLAAVVRDIRPQYKSIYNEYHNGESLLYDLLSMAFFNKLDYEKALTWAKKALAKAPFDRRIQNNVRSFQGRLQSPK